MDKNINIKVTQKDLIDNTEAVIYEGLALFNQDDKLSIEYLESKDTKVLIEVLDNTAFLRRISEAETEINFHTELITEAQLNSHLGKMKLEVKTEEITLKKDNLVIGYNLMQNKNIVSKFIMKVEWIHE